MLAACVGTRAREGRERLGSRFEDREIPVVLAQPGGAAGAVGEFDGDDPVSGFGERGGGVPVAATEFEEAPGFGPAYAVQSFDAIAVADARFGLPPPVSGAGVEVLDPDTS